MGTLKSKAIACEAWLAARDLLGEHKGIEVPGFVLVYVDNRSRPNPLEDM